MSYFYRDIGITRAARALLIAAACLVAVGARADERAAIEAIIRSATPEPSGEVAHPLPLVTQWNVGAWPGSFDPQYQLEQIRNGRYVLPTFNLEPPDGRNPLPYYESAMRTLAERGLPLSLASLQWELMIPKLSTAYPATDDAGNTVPLSPWGPVEPWYAAGRSWAAHPMLARMQELYPDPPFVLFVSNNEYPKKAWHELTDSPELIAKVGRDADPETIRRVVGDAWIERYRELIRGFREGLRQPAWREHSVFIGYDAFFQSFAGRWHSWQRYALDTPGRPEPWSSVWGGASASFYVRHWSPDTDFTVWSPQIEAMNLVPVLKEVMSKRPAYWFEISTWDGQEPSLPTDKAKFYESLGQTLTPKRSAGAAQFGMWLLRPRVVREFRGTRHGRHPFEPYFVEVMNAVSRVHENATLRRFWEAGALVANAAVEHPYQEALTEDMRGYSRWFLLDSPSNPQRPWRLDTPLDVYALALVIGEGATREWLIYAFSPRHATMETDLQIPDGPRVRVRAANGGCFHLVRAEAEMMPEGVTCSADDNDANPSRRR